MKKTLVIGASENTERYSNKAIKMLNQHQHPVLALGMRTGEVDGIKIQKEIDTKENVHTITMYVGPKNQPAYFDIITQLKPKRLILNPGTENPELEKLAKENDIEVIHGCTLVMLSTDQY
ncbi:MAG: CoA-binding protein [Salinivirgaceae bacterium]|nr:CoA-binding protein [Salinivirgaceae bacterium]MDD4746525.1 CoA-binding protein [Salinivirgaceae bacterium]MDY0279426.1 CoA-binding protein [Salinivirgaceae bacterium]